MLLPMHPLAMTSLEKTLQSICCRSVSPIICKRESALCEAVLKDDSGNWFSLGQKKINTMETKIQLKHPVGKKAVSMDKEKYEVVKKALVSHLKSKGESTHTEILHAITHNFKKDKIKFEGSIEWHMEWVKLDLESRKEIKRLGDKSPVKFTIA
jgi:hypothetical protein